MLVVVDYTALSNMANAEVRNELISYFNKLNGTSHTYSSLKTSGTTLKIPFRFTEVDGANDYHKRCFGLLKDDDYLYDWDYATYNLFDTSDKNACQGGCLQTLATQLLIELGFKNGSDKFKSYKKDITDNMAFIEGLYPEGMRQGNKWFATHPSVTLAEYTRLSGYVSKVPKA